MHLYDKLLLLRKKAGMTQAELAESLNVSRQAVSKWELGTALPDVENMISLSRLFNVSVDYLVNDEIESELDAPIVKKTVAVLNMKFKNKLIGIVIGLCIVFVVTGIGAITNSVSNAVLSLLVIGLLCLIYFVLRLLAVFIARKK